MAASILLLLKSLFKQELQALGHSVVALAPRAEYDLDRADAWSFDSCDGTFDDQESIFTILDRLHPFVPDYILYHDDSFPALRVRDLERLPIPTIYYAVDVHIHSSWQRHVSGIFDHTFIAQRDYLPTFQERSPHVSWLPLWAPQYIEPSSQKEIPVCFRGTLTLPQRQQRVDFLTKVAETIPLDIATGDYKEPYRRASIVLNEQIADDVNFRVFEAIMSGACLVTPATGNGLGDLFAPGTHLITYTQHDPHDAATKIADLVANPERCAAIAHAGREHLLQHHRSQNRARTVAEILPNLTVRRSPHASQIALYDALRWWGMSHGDYTLLPEAWWEYLLKLLDETISQPHAITEETIFALIELADAVCADTPSERLYSALSQLIRREETHAGALMVIHLHVARRLGYPIAGAEQEVAGLYHELKRSSTFRVFDRNG